ncbi:hypothetical protein Dimus_025331 [Dionaea muscipula]
MEEPIEEKYHADESMEKEGDMTEDNSSSLQPAESFLAQLNLVMVMAFLTLSPEELLQFEETETISAKEQETNVVASKLQSRKRELKDFKVTERRPSKMHTRIVDSRHGRRM